jgi:triosephosphate isomerase
MPPLVGTSLKMHLTATETRAYLERLRGLATGVEGCALFVLPSFPALWVAREVLAGTGIAWGAQDVHEADGGAHTGDVSARMLVDLGCTYVEVGHAERRRDHGETDLIVGAKVDQAMRGGLIPIVCLGETDDLGTSRAVHVVTAQLATALGGVRRVLDEGGASTPGDVVVVVAYEPVWAIGTGSRPAAPEHVETVHGAIHEALAQGPLAGREIPVIYGGSVDPASGSELAARPGVDGLFVGRAALDPAALVAIAASVAGAAAARA